MALAFYECEVASRIADLREVNHLAF
jgi:hypothetical protein